MARLASGVFALIASLSVFACSAAEEATTDTSTNEIIGGIDAVNPEFNSVGYLAYRGNDGTGSSCTGTLIAPSVVLTAKHCVMADPNTAGSPTRLQTGKVYFLVGQDPRSALGGVEVESVEVAPLFAGGFTNHGSDVAVYRLKTPITTVPSLAVASTPLPQSDVNTSFIAIGYGQQGDGNSGTRKIGAVRLGAVTGSPSPGAFGSFEAYVSETQAMMGSGGSLSAEAIAQLRARYDAPLADDYEAFLAPPRALGEVQPCHGDSGGPLLRRENGKLVVHAVVSTSAAPGQGCKRGTIYATFGAATREMIAKAVGDHCAPDASGKLVCGLAADPTTCAMLDGAGSTTTAPFVQCLANSCCSESTACFGDTECSALSNCFRDCAAAGTDSATTSACSNACYRARSASYTKYEAYRACGARNCANVP